MVSILKSLDFSKYHKIDENIVLNIIKPNCKNIFQEATNYVMTFKRATVLAFQPIFQPLFKIWVLHKLFVYFALFTPFTFLRKMIIHRYLTSNPEVQNLNYNEKN